MGFSPSKKHLALARRTRRAKAGGSINQQSPKDKRSTSEATQPAKSEGQASQPAKRSTSEVQRTSAQLAKRLNQRSPQDKRSTSKATQPESEANVSTNERQITIKYIHNVKRCVMQYRMHTNSFGAF